MNIKLKQIVMGIAAASAMAFATASHAADITGAGATFPYPVYAKWAEAYKKETGVGMNYQSIGSGGGIKQIKAGTVDFGATDAPLNANELGLAGLAQFPTVIGGVVPVINVAGISAGQLKLSSDVLADIFLGKITQWNDPKIAALNKGVNLPAKPITVVHRADGSGTTHIFTSYLAKVNTEWMRTVGADKAVQWPVGTGGKGNEGVAANVKNMENSIGYVEYAYALQNKIAYAQLKNKDGQFVEPNDTSFKAAAGNAKWKAEEGFAEILVNQPGKDSWPITGATFILVYKNATKNDNRLEVLKFFNWAYAHGDKMAADLDYVPLPDNVTTMISNAWKAQVKDSKGQALWK
jgi:phosphate transport system substrate-binding protein